VACLYNVALVVLLIVHILWPIFEGQCWLLDCDDGCNRLELVHNKHKSYAEWCLISLDIFADVNVRILQNMHFIIIGTNDMILNPVVYGKSLPTFSRAFSSVLSMSGVPRS
jgi:hypothetical protein